MSEHHGWATAVGGVSGVLWSWMAPFAIPVVANGLIGFVVGAAAYAAFLVMSDE